MLSAIKCSGKRNQTHISSGPVQCIVALHLRDHRHSTHRQRIFPFWIRVLPVSHKSRNALPLTTAVFLLFKTFREVIL